MPTAIPISPLLTFNWLIFFVGDSEPIAGATKISGGVGWKTNEIAFRTGGSPWNSASKIPGGMEFEKVDFEFCYGANDERFHDWAMATNNWKMQKAGHQPADFRKDIMVQLQTLDGKPGLQYILHDGWCSGCKLHNDLEASNLNTVAIRVFSVQYEGISYLT